MSVSRISSFVVAVYAVFLLWSPVSAATFSSACASSCTSAGGVLQMGSCTGGFVPVSSVSGCFDTDVGSPTYKQPATCCKSGSTTPTCGATTETAKASCIDITTCVQPKASTVTGYAYKVYPSAACPDTEWCCEALPDRPGYVPDTYDETACTKLNGTCLPTSCGLDTSITKVGDCGAKSGVSFVCCGTNTALTASASTDASKAAAAGSVTSGTDATVSSTLPAEKPLVTAAKYGYQPPLGDVGINTIVGRIIQVVSGVVGALFLVMFLWGGFKWLTAGGDAKKVQSAREILTSAVIGIVIILGAYLIVSNFVTILGTSLAS